MFLEVRNCRTTSDVWAGALSWCRNQLLFFHLSGGLRRMPSVSCFKSSQYNLSLTVWQGCTNSLWTMPWVLKKLSTWTWHCCELEALFRSRWIWRLPLRRLLLISRVINLYPCIITVYDIGNEIGVVSGLLFEFAADSNAMGLLVVAQQSWHKYSRNASHIQIVRQSALNGPVWQSYSLTNIVDSLPLICKDSFAKFAMFSSAVFVDCRPEPSSSSTHVCPTLKRLQDKKFCFGSRHYLWRLPVAFGGFLQ